LLSVASATSLTMCSTAPHSVSSDFGQLAAKRHLSSGIDCAMAGAARVAAPAAPIPVTLRKSLLFIESITVDCVCVSLLGEACGQHGTTGFRFPSRTGGKMQKSPVSRGDRAVSCASEFGSEAFDQPRVRERIMKLS